MLENLLKDIAAHDDVLLVVKNGTAISEVRGKLTLRASGEHATLENGPCGCHVHLRLGEVRRARFVEARRTPERSSYSVQLFASGEEPVLAAYFPSRYDEEGKLLADGGAPYRELRARYGSRDELTLGGES